MYHFNPSCQMIETRAIVCGRIGLKAAKKKNFSFQSSKQKVKFLLNFNIYVWTTEIKRCICNF